MLYTFARKAYPDIFAQCPATFFGHDKDQETMRKLKAAMDKFNAPLPGTGQLRMFLTHGMRIDFGHLLVNPCTAKEANVDFLAHSPCAR